MALATSIQHIRRPVFLVYLGILATHTGRSMYLIIISWLALRITGESASVGKVLMWSPVLSVAVGPVIGSIVDRFNRSSLLICGECLWLVGLIWLTLNVHFRSAAELDIVALYLTACIVGLGSLFSAPAAQGLLQAVGGGSFTRVVALGVSFIQVGVIVGAILGGLSVALLGIEGSLILCASCSLAVMCLAVPLHQKGKLPLGGKPPSYFVTTADGFAFIFRNPCLLLACLTVILIWSVTHMSMALLAALTRIDLGLGADAYGWIEAMWGGGAIIGGIMVACFAGPSVERCIVYFGPLCLAAATAAFSLAQDLWSALLLHALLGLAFAVNRTVYDAYILRMVDCRLIGRVRNNIQAVIGLVAIAVYLSPSISGNLPVRVMYLCFGIVLALAAAALLAWRLHLNTAPRASSVLPFH